MKRVLVVGGGIGGLASAIGLCRAGWQVTVQERAEDLAGVGTGLGVWPEALAALDRLGIGDLVRDRGRRQASGLIRRPDGRRIATIDTARLERRTGESVYLIARPDLLRILFEAVPAGVVHFAAEVTDPAAALQEYDLVVGADGISSRVRSAVFGPKYGLRYDGRIAWRGVVDLELEQGGETWGAGKKFGFTPQAGGRTNFYAVRRTSEHCVFDGDDLADLGEHFGDWHDPIPRVLAAVDSTEMLRHPLHYLDPPLPTYVRGNVALLGDAAHAMPPDLGQGACQALIDGLTLSECLLAAADVSGGLEEYDRQRRKPSQRIAAMAIRIAGISTATRFLRLRDAATRIALAVTSPGG